MKILWVTNILFGHHCTMMGMDASKVYGGSWLFAAYASSWGVKNLTLHIATVAKINERLTGTCDGNFFYILPGGGKRNYDVDSQTNIREWIKLREEVKPDVVIIWGTETRAAYLASKVMRGIPIAIYVQGVMSVISAHYYEGIPYQYRNKTFRDFLNKYDLNSEYKHFMRQNLLESEMLHFADAIIVENNWCEDVCKLANHKLKVFRNDLPIRELFYKTQWSIEKAEPLTIFTNAGGYPIKGHHILFQALAKVKNRFPDFKCYIPGNKLEVYRNIKRRTGYISYLEKLLKDGNIEENVIYTGSLTSEEMVTRIEHCNVFVMPSMVENQSSSLIEAMIMGAPCITSLVGGMAGIIKQNYNGIMYNSMDSSSLAGSIIRVFEDKEFAQLLGKHALELKIIRSRNFGDEMLNVYKALIEVS